MFGPVSKHSFFFHVSSHTAMVYKAHLTVIGHLLKETHPEVEIILFEPLRCVQFKVFTTERGLPTVTMDTPATLWK